MDSLYELNKLFENKTSREEMKAFMKLNDHEIICIAYVDNIAAGYCTGLMVKSVCHKSRRLDIEALFVKEEYRKKGIGKALINFLEKEAEARSILHFHIVANKKNKTAKSLYKKSGYEDTGEILLDKTLSNEEPRCKREPAVRQGINPAFQS